MKLQPRARKAAVVAHVVSSAAWIGLDAAKTILVFTGIYAGDRGTVALAYQALGTFLGWPLVVASLAALVTGLVLGVGTRWGLVTHWWVAAKLGITLVLVLMVCFVLAPMLPDVAAYGTALAAGTVPVPETVADLVYPAVVAPTALLAATILSVVKPWGRIRRSAPPSGDLTQRTAASHIAEPV
ncbi:hypothetical protein ACQEVB_26695 [Pseudonocardia sp. CA-107938]|uniref:hypothetical protein n=1 Tax=Pseudonocardia sp. CA-107938 TaxID=3240021 RepID=UPI003D91B10F